jgi:hypothetical protein
MKYDAQPEVVENETVAPLEENEVKTILTTPTSTTTMQTILEFKNIIHGAYSPSPPEVFPMEKSQGLSPELEDPPEVLQADQNVEITE